MLIVGEALYGYLTVQNNSLLRLKCTNTNYPFDRLLYEGHKSWTPQLLTQKEYTLKDVFVNRCKWIINFWILRV